PPCSALRRMRACAPSSPRIDWTARPPSERPSPRASPRGTWGAPPTPTAWRPSPPQCSAAPRARRGTAPLHTSSARPSTPAPVPGRPTNLAYRLLGENIVLRFSFPILAAVSLLLSSLPAHADSDTAPRNRAEAIRIIAGLRQIVTPDGIERLEAVNIN